MYFGNGSQYNDFLFNVIKLLNSSEEKILALITDNELIFSNELKFFITR